MPEATGCGTVVVLHGTSSSGKTSIARALQADPERMWFYVGTDTFWSMFPRAPQLEDDVAHRMAVSEAFLQSAATLSRHGLDVVVDAVIIHPAFRRQCFEAFSELGAHFVGVHCDIEELEQREAARGDRKSGLARWQSERVHEGLVYDLEVDTTAASPEECASAIARYLENDAAGTAFQRLLTR